MEKNKQGKTVDEYITVAGNQLVDKVKELIAEGNVRRIVLRRPNGETLMEIPLTAGVVVGGVVTLAAWWVAALVAIAAVVTKVRIDIVREVTDEKNVVEMRDDIQ